MIRELKTFLAVAREGTFAAAGKKVGLTQAAVSAQMQRLEAELGFALFMRTGRSARLNEMGQQTLGRAQELVRLYDDLGARQVGHATTTLVTIGAIASVQRSRLPDVLARFHREHPDCRTRVLPGVSMGLADQVDAGDIDMAAIIRPPLPPQGDLRWTTLAREPFRLLVPRHTAGDDWGELLSREPFVRYDRVSFGGRQVDRFLRRTHLAVHEVCELDELEAIVRLVANGVGIALVPETAGHRKWPAAVRVVDLGHHTFHREIGLLHRASGLSKPAQHIVRMLRAIYDVPSSRRGEY
ncbi:LysR substrate-binding domain-containing protein [Pendulispora rubella]|uniref:LysR substrate-binding domain-containing protein n=1 Tax=Pendulispora rubella TaxID=2741070 RepID=A0ABZ2L6X2_9BACT